MSRGIAATYPATFNRPLRGPTGTPGVAVMHNACDRIASLLVKKSIPLDREDAELPDLDRHLAANFFLALVAICHQTTPRGRLPLEGTVGGIRHRGWDYLFARFEEAVVKEPGLLSPSGLSSLSAKDVQRFFHDPDLGHRLNDVENRAALLRDLGERMCYRNWQSVEQMYHLSNGQIATGAPNLLQLLAEFRAYNDPVRKKSYFFLALMRNSGLWRYEDDHALGPPVDYHEVRGHLRLGTVQINDGELLERVRSGREVTETEDIVIRLAVHDAIMYISAKSGLNNPSQLHYLFWNLFRSICTRQAPQCFELKNPSGLPDRYLRIAENHGSARCPFVQLCPSAGSPAPITEHVIETDYY